MARRSPPPTNFYGVDLGGTIDISTDPFSVSGVVHLEIGDGGSGFQLGYGRGTDSYGSGGDSADFIGMHFDDGNNVGAVVWSSTMGRTLDQGPADLPFGPGVTVPFSMVYDPNDFSGNGSLTVTVNGSPYTMNLGVGNKNDLAPLTHLQVMPVSADGGTSTVWFGDLTFTAVQEIPALSDFNWAIDGPGNWNVGGNSDLGVPPNAATHNAIFGNKITSPNTVFLEDPMTVESIRTSTLHARRLTRRFRWRDVLAVSRMTSPRYLPSTPVQNSTSGPTSEQPGRTHPRHFE